MRLLVILLLSGISIYSQAQQTLHIKTTGAENKMPIPASILIKGTTQGSSADTTGIATISFTANGNYTLIISAVGHEEKETKVTIPHTSDTLEIELESGGEELEEVVVQSTRTSRTI